MSFNFYLRYLQLINSNNSQMKTKFNGILTLLLALTVQFVFAQKTVSGTVSDESGALPGVSVMIKGTKTGTETDFDGKYSLQAKQGEVLVYSYVGKVTTEKTVGAANTIDVKLMDDANVLDEVVISVLGIETTRDSKLASSSTVKGGDLIQAGESSVIKALSGKASGVQVTNSSGDPGSSAYIQIRGQTSITRDLQPLFVIDGMPINNDELGAGTAGVGQQSRLNDLNPNDIESVKILKGAAAAAFWGSKAGNGVILITTKSGKKISNDSFEVSVFSKYSVDSPLSRVELQEKYGRGSNGAGATYTSTSSLSYGDLLEKRSGVANVYNTTTGGYFETPDGTKLYPITQRNDKTSYVDKNYESVFGNGTTIESGASISAKSGNSNYFVSLSRLKQDGIIGAGDGTNFYEKYNGRINVETKVADKIKLKGNIAYSNVNSNRIQQGSNLSGLLLGLYRTSPDFDQTYYIGTKYSAAGIPNFNSQRSYRVQGGTNDRRSPLYNNPLWTIYKQKNPNEVDRVIGGLEFNYMANEWLTFIAKTGIDTYQDNRQSLFPLESAENAGKGSFSQSTTNFNSYNTDLLAIFNKDIIKKLSSNLTIGVNFNQEKYEQNGGGYLNFILDSDAITYSNSIVEDRSVFTNSSQIRNNAAYGLLSLDYMSKVMLDLSYRLEKSSTFGSGKSFSYPSAILGFDVAKFFETNGLFNKANIKLAWGQVGHAPAAYATDLYYYGASDGDSYGPAYDASSYAGSFVPSVVQPDKNIKPEIITESEVALELKLLRNRIGFNIGYYKNNVDDALLSINFPASTGFSRKYTNAGKMENKGLEIDFNADVIKKESFVFSLGANWAKNQNVVTDLFGAESVYLDGFQGTSSRAVEGHALGTLWGGLFNRDANGKLVLDANGFPTVAPEEGVLGDPNPDWRGGFNSGIKYKNFELSGLFDVSMGGKTWNGTFGALTNFGMTPETANQVTVSAAEAATIVDYNGTPLNSVGGAVTNSDGSVTVRGNLQDFGAGKVLLNQAYYTNIGGGFGPVAEQFITDASWAKLREVTFSYNMNTDLIKKAGLNSVTFSLSGRNLWLWTKADLDFDPESNLTGASNGRGLQYFNHPTTKSYVGSIQINF